MKATRKQGGALLLAATILLSIVICRPFRETEGPVL